MRAGRLRHRVTIQQNAPTQNSLGEPVDAWTTYATVYADIRPLRTRELVAGGQVVAEVTTPIRIRRTSGVSAAMRVLHGSTVYSITGVLDFPERGEMELVTTQGLNSG